MGCFGGGSVQAQRVPTASEIFQEALGFFQSNFPLSLEARESGLADLLRGTEFFEEFQPTSFEQALGQQQFANIIPDVERSIKQSLSLSGLASSPILAREIARARGSLQTDIGEILTNVANQRALSSLATRIGLDPGALLSPFVQTGQTQANLQSQLNALADEQRRASRSAGIGSIGTILGGLGGFALGGPAGAGLGASLGGTASTLFGGSGSPISFGDALSFAQFASPTTSGFVQPGSLQAMLQGFGSGTPPGVFNTGTMSIIPGLVQPVFLE